MKSFAQRRFRSLTFAVLAAFVMWLWLRWIDNGLGRTSFASGYLLYGFVLFLALFNLRKKLPTLPLGSASAWLQLHIYVGLLAGAVFGMHLAWRVPNGWFECLLAMSFMMTFVSGVVGLVITRRTPRLLNRVGQEVIYERTPTLRRDLAMRSRQAVLASASDSGSDVLANFYTNHLFDFFARPRPFGYFFLPASIRRKRLLGDLQQLQRYLTPAERQASDSVFAMIRSKDDLDFQQVQQLRLKLWLFMHIGLTYVLIAVATVHGAIALAFRGDW